MRELRKTEDTINFEPLYSETPYQGVERRIFKKL